MHPDLMLGQCLQVEVSGYPRPRKQVFLTGYHNLPALPRDHKKAAFTGIVNHHFPVIYTVP
jgi:hypothetical protein